MYKQILVPIDGSEPSQRGLAEAIKLAGQCGGAVRLVHIVNELLIISPYGYSANFGDVFEIMRTEGRALLETAEKTVREAGVKVDKVLVDAIGSQAGAAIVAQAEKWPADLIVCGTHGRRGIRRLLMGSDAEYVVRHTPVPVLLVRSQERERT
jgi:nucleotide-binding universal stress UspA family protein